MWTESNNKSGAVTSTEDNSKMVDPDVLTLQVFSTLPLRNNSGAAATQPQWTDDPLTRSGIIPGAIAATVFIIFLLVLYTVLWKCMVSPPKRKKRKKRVKGSQQVSV